MNRDLGGTLYEGTPPVVAVPTAMPTREGGVLALLVLVVEPGVDPAEVDDFVGRYHLVPRDQVARAADSQARWTLERTAG